MACTTPGSSSCSLPSPTAASALREADLNALRRAATHCITTLDVLRRKWQIHSEAGRTALSGCVNARLRFAHAEAGEWPAEFRAVRSGVALRALHQQREAEENVGPVLIALETVVGEMRSANEALRVKAEQVMSGGSRHPHPLLASELLLHGESIERIISRTASVVRAYERELHLRRTIAVELAGVAATGITGEEADESQPPLPPRKCQGPGWDVSARLLLSAWVLEPNIEGEQHELVFDSLAAEPSVVVGGSGGGRRR